MSSSSDRAERLAGVCLALSLLPLLGGIAWLVVLGPFDPTQPRAWPGLASAGLGWLLAIRAAARVRDSVGVGFVLLGGALALRCLAWAGDFALTDDLYRYGWEGGLIAAGVDPYRVAPDSPQVASFQQRWAETHAGVNHPHVRAAYPPLTQLVHALGVSLGGGPEPPHTIQVLFRGFYALCDLAVCGPLVLLLRRARRPTALAVVWAWSPWVAMEFAGAGHFDALGILLAITGLACTEGRARTREAWAALGVGLLALGAVVKLLPGAFVPFAMRRRRAVAQGTLAVGVLASVTLAYLACTGNFPRPAGLGEYAFRWESFNLTYRWIEPLFARLGPLDEGPLDPRRLARAFVIAAWLVLGVWAWRQRLPAAAAARVLVGGFLVLTPTLHPWYLLWMVPFLALEASRAWLWLVGWSPALYWPLARWRSEAVWSEPTWLWPLVGGGFLALFVLDAWRARSGRAP